MTHPVIVNFTVRKSIKSSVIFRVVSKNIGYSQLLSGGRHFFLKSGLKKILINQIILIKTQLVTVTIINLMMVKINPGS